MRKENSRRSLHGGIDEDCDYQLENFKLRDFGKLDTYTVCIRTKDGENFLHLLSNLFDPPHDHSSCRTSTVTYRSYPVLSWLQLM